MAGIVLPRAGALLVTASASVHLLMLHHLAALPALLMVAMVAVCLPCSVMLARGGSRRAWATVGVMGGLMVVVHHSWQMRDTAGHGGLLSTAATLLAAGEVGLAAVALIVPERSRA
jgi:hypothetical protein